MRIIRTIVYLIAFLSCAYSQDLTFKKITSTQGLSHNTVYAIVQDKRGFIWFGTREGLNRFDSYQVKTYYVKDSKLGVSSNKISALLNTGDNLLAGTDNGIYIYQYATDELKEFNPQSNSFAILCLSGAAGKLFAGTSSGLYEISNKHFKLIGEKQAVRAMCVIGDKNLLLSFPARLVLSDFNGRILREFHTSATGLLTQPDSYIFSIYNDRQGGVWLCSNQGLFSYNEKTQEFKRVRFTPDPTQEDNTVRSVSRKKENLYIGTENGLYIYNIQSGVSLNYQQSFVNNPKKLNDKAIYSAYTAKDGSVWLGTYFGGVNYFTSENSRFKILRPVEPGNGLAGKAVSQIMEDRRHRLWIATEDGGITVYDPQKEQFSYINRNTRPFYLAGNNVHAIYEDNSGNIWAGTFLGGLHRFDLKDHTTHVYSHHPHDPNSISNDLVYAIYQDSRGILWIGTQGGLNVFDYKNNCFHLFKPNEFGKRFIYDITEDQNGDMWFCTRQNGVFKYNVATDRLIHYVADGRPGSLSSNQVISTYQDKDHQLWFGTLDGGVCVFNSSEQYFKTYSIKDGLPNNNVYGILQDNKGRMWFSTNKGLSCFNPADKSFTNYDNKAGLPSNQFNFRSYLKRSNGWLYFGSINGLCFFSPETVTSRQSALSVRFTGFQLFNKTIEPGANSILKKQIDDTGIIRLSYYQNVFTINFAAINYTNPGGTNYAYYLEGFEKSWNYVGDRNAVTYTNLSPGDYIFHLKAVDAAGRTISDQRSLLITVDPPFYLTRTAYLLYFVMICLAVWLYSWFIKFLHKKKLEVQIERMEKDKVRILEQHRMNFFTFISHEFKTPLTLIIASIEKFIDDTGQDLKKNNELAIIRNNASRLFKLIQQLMEFRKIETEHASENLTKTDAVKLIREITLSFQTIAAGKQIDLEFSSDKEMFGCYLETDKIERILINLIFNAIKNTEKGGVKIDIHTSETSDEAAILTIKIIDTGRGMAANELEQAFDLFYYSKDKNEQGSGVGLALVHSLIQYLKAEIDIKSQAGSGTEIKLTIPVLKELTDDAAKRTQKKALPGTVSGDGEIVAHETREPEAASGKEAGNTKYSLLIVEDNKELLTFLTRHFSKQYQVMPALNGQAALHKLTKTPPDIIISDVKMPKMDGITLCNKLKGDKRYNYIPLILLSDSSEEGARVTGLDVGADAYLNKPFSMKELELLIGNMIKSRVELRKHITGLGQFPSGKLPENNKDTEFLGRLSLTLEKHFSDPKITIEQIAKELNMSRTLLHLNLKRLMNKSANELLNEYRLKKAVIMLGNNMPVNEISYYCGYSDPNYFSRIFKKHYGVTPLQFKNKGEQKEELVNTSLY